MLNYKGYDAVIDFDEEDEAIHGNVINIKDTIHFQADSAEGLRQAFHESVDDYLAWCETDGRPPAKPYSGKFQVRMAPEIHRTVALRAMANKMSLNAYIVHKLEHDADVTAMGNPGDVAKLDPTAGP